MNIMDSRYALEEQLGKGGMGVVYRAFDHLEGRAVALKRIEIDPTTIELNPLAASPRYQHMLLAHEFRTLASLRHPNIISVLDYGFTSRRQPFFVMELLDAPLTIVQAGEDRDSRGKIDLLIQVLQAIMYLHHHRMLHRDLKPNNVLVNQSGQVKVLDFGLAIKVNEHQEQVGTIHYMPPEVINHQSAVEASDLYAVGVIAYELFTGARPFTGSTHREIAEQITSALPDLTVFEQLAADDPAMAEITAIVARLLEKQPEDRFPDALSVVRALCQAIGELLPPDEGPIRESFLQAGTFVGREREMDEFQWLLAQAKERHGSAWLVGGESGIGKSRLLDELRIYAVTEDVMVLRGQITESGDSLAQCWGRILRPVILSANIGLTEARALKTIIPDIDSFVGIDTGDVPFPIEAGDLNFLIAELFSRITRPTLLILEDLQWATESLEPLKVLIPLLVNLPVLVVGSYRSDEAPHLPEQLEGANLLRLEKLSYESAAELSTSMLGSAGYDVRVLERLYQEAEGNAFFMVEVVRAWAEEAGHLSEIGQFELPESIFTGGIQNIVRRRLNRIPAWAYGGLQVAAVMGRNLNLEALDKILSPFLVLMTGEGISVSISTVWREDRGLKLDDWLLVCADAAILEVHDGEWRFAHDKLREQLLADLTADQMELLRSQVDKVVHALAAEGEGRR